MTSSGDMYGLQPTLVGMQLTLDRVQISRGGGEGEVLAIEKRRTKQFL